MKILTRKSRATTLVEIVLYFTLLGIFLGVAMVFAFQIADVSTLSGNMHELEYSSGELSKRLTESIQTAESVDEAGSVFNQDEGTLSLNMLDAEDSPTQFYWSNGNVFFQEGAQTAVQVNTPFVELSQLRFHRITSYKNPDQIVVDAVFRNVNEDLVNVDHEVTLHLILSLRR